MTTPGEISMTTLSMIDIRQQYRIGATPDSVFTILTDRIGEWWTHPYRLHDGDATIRVDRTLGGMVAEHWGDNFASWGTITRFENNAILEFSGQCGMDGAVYGLVRFIVTDDGPATTLELIHKAFGMISDETAANYQEGWRKLLTNLQSLAESS